MEWTLASPDITPTEKLWFIIETNDYENRKQYVSDAYCEIYVTLNSKQ